MEKILVLFFSRKGKSYCNGELVDLEVGNTECFVTCLTKRLQADVFEIRTKCPYPEDYFLCTEVAQEEARLHLRPELAEYPEDISDYDSVIIAGPNWWGSYPMAMFSLLEKLDFTGKMIYPVVSHEGSGIANILSDLEKSCPGAIIGDDLVLKSCFSKENEQACNRWIQDNFLSRRKKTK